MKSSIVKEHVRARFHAAAHTYDKQPGVQPQVAKKVLAMIDAAHCLDNIEAPRILEVGCGTGALTMLLASRFPGARILALDIAPKMIEHARGRLGRESNVQWQVADIRHLAPDEKFSLVASSSALHWMQPFSSVFKRLAEVLEPGGVIICGLMTRGTLCELHSLRRELTPDKALRRELPDQEAVIEAAAGAGLKIVKRQCECMTAHYPSAMEFLRILNRQGVTGGLFAPEQALNRAELKRLINEYQQRYANPGGAVIATYQLLFLEMVKS